MSVFISHNHADKIHASIVARRLQHLGVSVWMDDYALRAGAVLDQEIVSAIERCTFFLLIVSPNILSSQWVLKEISIAIEKERRGENIRIIPLIFDECDINDIIGERLSINLSDKDAYNSNFDKLLQALNLQKHWEPKIETLDFFDYHAALVEPKKIVCIATASSVDEYILMRDPDGRPFPLKDALLIEITPGSIRSKRFTISRIDNICLGENQSHYHAFGNVKTQDGDYAMDGWVWTINKKSWDVDAAHSVFSHKNWGWFPIFDNDLNVHHFSYAGYFQCINDSRGEQINKFDAEKKYIEHISRQSNGIIPNARDKIANHLMEIHRLTE